MLDKNLLDNSQRTLESKILRIITVGDILKHEYGPEAWTVEKLVPDQSITAITGAPGSFKTWLTIEIAKSVARGVDFLGKFKVTKGNVLIVDKENHMRHIQKRLKLLGLENEPIFYLSSKDDFLIDREKDFESLTAKLLELEIKVVIFDSLVRIHSGDENESQHIAKVMSAFRKITNRNITVIFIHHNRKEGLRTQSTTNSMRGSSDILAGLDCLLQVTKTSKDSLHITQSKLRQDEAVVPFAVRIISDQGRGTIELLYIGESDFSGKDIQDVKESIVAMLTSGEEMSRQEIHEALTENYKTATIDASLKELESANQISKKIGAKNRHSYVLNSESVHNRVGI